MIEGLVVSPRRQMVDERGKVMKFLEKTDPEWRGFEEVYFSWVNPGVVKAWGCHLRQTVHVVVPHGLVKLAVFDDRDGSATRGNVEEIFLGPDCYNLVCIPPATWFGWKCVAGHPSLVASATDHLPPDRAEEKQRRPFDDPRIPYNWDITFR